MAENNMHNELLDYEDDVEMSVVEDGTKDSGKKNAKGSSCSSQSCCEPL